jgi:hypothetical protein
MILMAVRFLELNSTFRRAACPRNASIWGEEKRAQTPFYTEAASVAGHKVKCTEQGRPP